MAWIEVYGSQRSLACELTTAKCNTVCTVYTRSFLGVRVYGLLAVGQKKLASFI